MRVSLYLALGDLSGHHWSEVLLGRRVLTLVHLLIPVMLLHRLARIDGDALLLNLELLLPRRTITHIAGADTRID